MNESDFELIKARSILVFDYMHKQMKMGPKEMICLLNILLGICNECVKEEDIELFFKLNNKFQVQQIKKSREKKKEQDKHDGNS